MILVGFIGGFENYPPGEIPRSSPAIEVGGHSRGMKRDHGAWNDHVGAGITHLQL